MRILSGKALVETLRRHVDSSTVRIWISSPYIGGWPGNVRRILGTKWQTRVKDVRLLTDIEAKGFKLSTMRQFFRRGTVRTLLGLHAKVYIVDDVAIVTSANLTGAAFSKRYEAGVLISGDGAVEVQQLFTQWWSKATVLIEGQLTEPASGKAEPGESPNIPLTKLNDLPPDAEDESLPLDQFGDYTAFLQAFDDLSKVYGRVQRLWKGQPIYYEVDAFLNYLYHYGSRPSATFATKAPRDLSEAERTDVIRKWAKAFARAYTNGEIENESASWRTERAKVVRRLLDQNARAGLSRRAIKELLMNLNSMNSYQVNIAKALNPDNNSLGALQGMLKDLVNSNVPVQRRMSEATERVFGLSKSSIQELVGFYYTDEYPLRNKNTNCGLRFLGYNVRVN